MRKKEFKVGETFQFGLTTLKVVPASNLDDCYDCALVDICAGYVDNHSPVEPYAGACSANERDDKTTVVFQEIETDEDDNV